MNKKLKIFSQTGALLTALSIGLFATGCASNPQVRTTTSVLDRDMTRLKGRDGLPLEALISKTVLPSVTLKFTTDSHVLDLESRRSLDSFVRNLGKADLKRLAVFGFADRRGTANYNDTLSNRRADAVAQWLFDNGILAKNYSVEGLGELYVPRLAKARIVQVRVTE